MIRIGDSISEAVGAGASDYHAEALADDGKLWLVSKQGIEQKSFSWFHRVSYGGGYVLHFDTKEKKWSKKVDFPAISTEENLEDHIFTFGSHLLMLLYSRYNLVKFRSLYEWLDGQWKKCDKFEVDAAAEVDPGAQRNELAFVPSAVGLYMVVTGEANNVTIQHMLLSESGGGELTTAKVSHFTKLDEVHFRGIGHVIMGGVHKDTLALISGVQGCGFRWEPNNPIVVDLKTKKSTNVTFEGATPPFSFAGSAANGVLSDGRWIHATGSQQKGMTGSAYVGQVWSMDLSKPAHLGWTQVPLEVPAPEQMDNRVLAVDTKADTLYMADKTGGVFSGKL